MAFTIGLVTTPIFHAKNAFGIQGEPPVWFGYAGTNDQVYTKGDVLSMGSGKILKAVDDSAPNIVIGICASTVTASAAVDGTDVVHYYPALPGNVFVGHLTEDCVGEDNEVADISVNLMIAMGINSVSTAAGYALELTGDAADLSVRVINYTAYQNNDGTNAGEFLYYLPGGIGVDNERIEDDGVVNPLVEFTFFESLWTLT